jgi:nucleoside-diphosphate-sugar epimerase
MHTILGAGGAIGVELASALVLDSKLVRLVGRHPKPVAGLTEVVAADAADREALFRAVAGSSVVYLVVGLKYDLRVWRELWLRILRNTIEACQRAKARLLFFDNVYMYGRVNGPMTEATPFNPCSRKGEIRAQLATALLQKIKAGTLTALIARAADFYGPHARSGIPNVLVFDKFAQGARASWLVNDAVKHSFTFTPDAARSLVLLANTESAWNQTWHVPTAADPPTGREFIQMAAKEFGVAPKYRVLGKSLIRLGGCFDRTLRELGEMLYQNDREYLFDSTKFTSAFAFKPTPYAEGIRLTANACRGGNA